MRSLILSLALLPLCAQAQMYGQPDNAAPYPYKKQYAVPPGGVVYDQGGPGIPTSGLDQARQLESNRPGQQKKGPVIMHRSYDKKGSTSVISGPNGTTVCTDAYGNRSSTTVCY